MNLSNTAIMYAFIKAAYNLNVDLKEVWVGDGMKLVYTQKLGGQTKESFMLFTRNISVDELELAFADALQYTQEIEGKK